ncbi:hypothetical protein D3C71_1856750 [compost metagenome]
MVRVQSRLPNKIRSAGRSRGVTGNGDPFLLVRQAWRVARKRNQLGCGGLAGDLEVKVLYTPGKGKC